MEMRTAAEWLNPVKASGIAAYLVASASCGLTALRAMDRCISRLATVLGLVQVSLLLDIAFDLRWRLYDWLRSQAVVHQWYERRHWPQVAMLIILAVLLLGGARIVRRRFQGQPGVTLALEGTLLSIGCWAVEVISLHATDAILYHRSGPLMVISFVWILACLMTSAGVLRVG